MKKILTAGVIALLSPNSFAQIDDVINKTSSSNKEVSSGEGSLFASIGKGILYLLIPKLESIGITSLVDEMKRDGVKERRFQAAFDVEGRLATISSANVKNEDSWNVIPFSVKLSTDNKVQVNVGILESVEWLKKFIEVNDYYNPFVPFSKFRVATFILDDGMEFRDIKRIGFNVLEVESTIPVMANSSDSYIALIAGGDWGYFQESIKLDNGSVMKLQSMYEHEDIENVADGKLGLSYGIKAGFEIKDRIGKSTLRLRGVVELSELFSGRETPYKSNKSNHWERVAHTRIYARPEIVINTPLGKKKKRALELSVGGNLRMVDKVRSYSEKDYQDFEQVHFENRTRRPVEATLRLKF